jgi:hypothetical protein
MFVRSRSDGFSLTQDQHFPVPEASPRGPRIRFERNEFWPNNGSVSAFTSPGGIGGRKTYWTARETWSQTAVALDDWLNAHHVK